ncbi:hypothetical protein I5U23_14515 [Stenotrophomonas maltophilia]|uniref:DUF4214 domain-containing protein n=1 Tax=Stenotrophomonas riyadhensis TaxID=2859893 RepID=A0ABT2XJ00_9GAMM|nr:hypothetical protein [Stenotrophomonas sp. CFS3442]MBH1619128.1 hypothetical protein [Stenotrophomonas maltophilia]MCV0325912.1 hypothetical protein [Stenotrophomonas sp. CFS3442]HEL4244124.1 hypothetical protein [Stenotrophomonas maltophilia]
MTTLSAIALAVTEQARSFIAHVPGDGSEDGLGFWLNALGGQAEAPAKEIASKIFQPHELDVPADPNAQRPHQTHYSTIR